jgi:hypothetical protein
VHTPVSFITSTRIKIILAHALLFVGDVPEAKRIYGQGKNNPEILGYIISDLGRFLGKGLPREPIMEIGEYLEFIHNF